MPGHAAKLAKIPRIVYRRGSAKPIKNSILNRFLFKNIITHLLANSEKTKQTILAKNKDFFPEQSIKVVYNGINPNNTKNKTNKLYTKSGAELTIGSAGRLSWEKGQEKLILLAKELQKQNINFKILIAGKGPKERELKELRAAHHVEDNVELLGFVSDFSSYVNSLDVFVLTSVYEGFDYVMIEAMAAGKPVLAFDIGTTSEIIEEGKSGYIIPQGDVTLLADKIIYLSKHPNEMLELGQRGKAIVQNKFTLQKCFLALQKELKLK